MNEESRLPARAAPRTAESARESNGPLDAFIRAVEASRFDGRIGRIGVIALLPLVVAFVAGRFGPWPAVITGAAIALGIALLIVAWDRPRWAAGDALYSYSNNRHQAWRRDTDGPSPADNPIASEVWLGVHQPGTVPQFYRVIAAGVIGDPARLQSELVRMPDVTALDRIQRIYAVETVRFAQTGAADVAELEELADLVPADQLRDDLRPWLALVEAKRRWSSGERDWAAPLVAERSRSRSRPLPRGRCLRIWLSRTGPVLAFTIGALLLGWFSVRDAETAAIRPEYEQTTYAMRGELPAFDDQAFIRALPALERVLPASTRAVDRPLDDEGFDEVVANGMPTLIWTTGAIEVARPSDAGPHRVYEIEAILGSLAGPRVILTFDGPNGPRYLYEIDPEVFSTLRAASGLGATPPP